MATVNVYLTFPGNCEQAFNFYKSVFSVEFSDLNRFKDMPAAENPQVPPGMEDKIMHVSLPISKETILMGSDGGDPSVEFVQGNNFSLSVAVDSKAEADKIFQALSEGGKVTFPIADTFWGSYFGMLTDAFGISWMVSFDTNN